MDSKLENNLHQLRWPKLVGLEQVFQEMDIAKKYASLDIPQERAGTDESIELHNKGNKKILQILLKFKLT